MRKLELTDDEANRLITILKIILRNYKVDLSPGNKEDIQLKSISSHNFILTYFTPPYRDDKISIHLREKDTNTNLVRVNIDPVGFHKNSDGEKINGNRILLFSSEEWVNKNDGATQVKAYDLPSDFTDTSNLEQVFLDYLMYINVKQEGKIVFPDLL